MADPTVPTWPAGLSALQQHVAALLADVRHPRIGAALALVEEVGELAKLLTEREVYGQPLDRAALGAELADILVLLCELSAAYELDLGAAAQAKLEHLAAKVPQWRAKYGPHLAACRQKWDG